MVQNTLGSILDILEGVRNAFNFTVGGECFIFADDTVVFSPANHCLCFPFLPGSLQVLSSLGTFRRGLDGACTHSDEIYCPGCWSGKDANCILSHLGLY